jgi:ADP-heptose:LPS heptosyltransferase
LHNNIRSTRIKQSLNVPSVTFRKLNIKKFLLTHLKINRLPKIHIVDRYLETCSEFGIKNDGKGLDYFIDAEENFNPSALSPFFQKGYIVFVIGGTYFTKRLPSEKIVEICSRIVYPVILLGGKNEVKSGNFIESNSKGNVINLAGKLSLNQSASLVRDARLVLTNDTGLMHIAAAFKKKILSFWGNTVPDFGMFPYLPDASSEIIEISDLRCRPCSKIGYDKCPKKHFRCMNEISTDLVTGWIKKNY